MTTRKENSFRILLQQNYISKSVIQQVLGTSHEIASKVFSLCKSEELKKAPIIEGEPLDFRPQRVSTKIFLKVTQQDYGFIRKQYIERKGDQL